VPLNRCAFERDDLTGSQVMQVIREGLSHEGPGFLMKGWTPAWLRLTQVDRSLHYEPLLTGDRPHTVLTFVIMEKLLELVNLTPSAPARATV
jgi:dicarboxylate transporter 10